MEVNNIEPVDVEKVAEENPQSRFRILNVPILAPGTCGLCGSPGGDGRQFVDFGKQLDWYGAVYFCTFCVAEAAKLLYFKTLQEHEALFAKYEKALLDYGNANLEIERLQEQLNAARVLLRNCDCGSPDANGGSADSISVDVESDEQGFDGTSSIDASSGLKGFDDVPASSGDDDAISKPKRTRRTSSPTE